MSDDDDDSAPLLPEDDSIFELSTRSNMSGVSDVLVEDPSFVPDSQSTPTIPAAKRRRGGREPPAQRDCSPSQPSSSASTPPRRSSRRTSSPTPYQSPTALRHRGAAFRSSSPSVRPSTASTLALPGRGVAPSINLAQGAQITDSVPSRRHPDNPAPAAKLKCPKCTQVLANKKTLDRHLRGHLMKGIMSKAPSRNDYAEAMKTLVVKSLDDILNEPTIGDLCSEVHSVAKQLKDISENLDLDEGISHIAECFSDIVEGHKILFPSSICNVFHVNVNRLLASDDFRKEMKCNFGGLVECSDSVLNVFLGNFMLKLCDAVIVYTMQKIRDATTASTSRYRRRSKDDINSLEFRQLSYYIGGSVVSGFLWKGDQYSKSSNVWSAYCHVLREQFLRSDETGENACDESIRAHTDSADRGGLTHISNAAFSFFITLFHFLMGLEGDDDSLPPEVVDNHILLHDVILCLWDVLVGNYLKEDLSIDLLCKVCESCVKTVTEGRIKRRLNAHIQKAFNSVALRARLAA